MKRIIDGKTYNTDTSTEVALARVPKTCDPHDDREEDHTLYVTRGGAFFVHVEETETNEDGEPVCKNRAYALTRDEAHDWILRGDVELLNDRILGEPPEASGEEPTKPEATIYIRVPEPLKQQIEGRAKDSGQSINAWAIRCLERCVKSERQAIAEALTRKEGS